jgi:antitoxin VapB
MTLSEPEQDDLRLLGALAAHALETGIDAWRPGESTDFEIAAAVSRELERYGAKAVCLIVGGDDRLRALRHPLAIGAVVDAAVMAVVVARRGGLHVAATRIAVTNADDPIVQLTQQLAPVHQAVLGSSVPGHTWGDAVEALAKGYENIGQPGAWREHFQGGPIAFEQREFELAPGQVDSPYWDLECGPGTAVAWNPSLRGGAKIEETYLVGNEGFEFITNSGAWATSNEGAVQHSQVKVVQ